MKGEDGNTSVGARRQKIIPSVLGQNKNFGCPLWLKGTSTPTFPQYISILYVIQAINTGYLDPNREWWVMYWVHQDQKKIIFFFWSSKQPQWEPCWNDRIARKWDFGPKEDIELFKLPSLFFFFFSSSHVSPGHKKWPFSGGHRGNVTGRKLRKS